MIDRRIAVGLMIAVVVGLFLVTLGNADGNHGPKEADVTIVLGEMFFAVEGAERKSFPPPTPPESIVTISGASDGEISILFKNVGQLLHEILSPLFLATIEAEVEVFDAEGHRIGKVESANLLEVYVEPGMMAKVTLELSDAIVDSLKKDPDLTMTFEIACHIAGHYEAGQRALITVAP